MTLIPDGPVCGEQASKTVKKYDSPLISTGGLDGGTGVSCVCQDGLSSTGNYKVIIKYWVNGADSSITPAAGSDNKSFVAY